MEKPVSKTLEYLDYLAMTKYIESKYGYDTRDYCGKHKASGNRIARWEKWLVDTFGKTYQELKAELGQVHPDWGTKYKCTEKEEVIPYQDYWHMMVEYFGDFSNGSYTHLNLADVLGFCTEDWQKKITNDFITEFGDKDLMVVISW